MHWPVCTIGDNIEDLGYDPAKAGPAVRTINGRVIPPRSSADDPIDPELLAIFLARTPTVHMAPEILRGMPVFRDTLVPIKVMFDQLDSGQTLDNFLATHPEVSPATALETLNNHAVLFYEKPSAEASARLARSVGDQQGD